MATNPAQLQPATAPPRRSFGADFLVLAAIVALIFSLIDMGHEWHHPFQSKVDINLSPWYLPYYTMLSFMRGAVAYGMSFVFTLFYARWAAYDRNAEKLPHPAARHPAEPAAFGLPRRRSNSRSSPFSHTATSASS